MSDAGTRNMDGSQDSLRQAVGRLDAAAIAQASRASGGLPRRLSVRLSGRWLLLLALVAVAAAALTLLAA